MAKRPSPARTPRTPAAKAPPRLRTAARPAARRGTPAGPAAPGPSASRLIDQRIRELGGWRGETLARVRALIRQADPEATEEWKWDVPVWSHHGIICTGEAYARAVKLTFAHGASVPDPSRLFNASLAGATRRAIDIHEGAPLAAGAFKALVKAAVALNRLQARAPTARAAPRAPG